MAWLRVDDKFADNPKVEGLASDPKTHGDALAVWIILASDCARRETDGSFTPERVQKCFPTWRKSRRDAALNSLLRSKLINLVNGSFNFHDWLVYNPSKESQEKKREISRNDWTKRRNLTSDRHQTDGSLMTPVPVPVPVPVFSSKEENRASAPRSPSEKANEWLTSWRSHFKVSDEISNTPARTRCVEAALKRHGLEKCLDAIRGYAANPWRHEKLSRHDVSVILGSGGTTKDDKVVYGLELLSESQPLQLKKTPEPETELDVARAVLQWLDAGDGELVCPLKYIDHESRQWPVARPFDIVARKVFNDWLLLSAPERLARVASIRADFSAKLSGVTC